MSTVRPVAAAPSAELPADRRGRGSRDLFADLLQVAGGRRTDLMTTSGPRRGEQAGPNQPGADRRGADRNTGCVVRPRPEAESPASTPDVTEGTDVAGPTDGSDASDVADRSTEAADRPLEPLAPEPVVPAAPASSPAVLDAEALLNAGKATARVALPADGWVAAPVTGAPVTPGSPGRSLPGRLTSSTAAATPATPTLTPSRLGSALPDGDALAAASPLSAAAGVPAATPAATEVPIGGAVVAETLGNGAPATATTPAAAPTAEPPAPTTPEQLPALAEEAAPASPVEQPVPTGTHDPGQGGGSQHDGRPQHDRDDPAHGDPALGDQHPRAATPAGEHLPSRAVDTASAPATGSPTGPSTTGPTSGPVPAGSLGAPLASSAGPSTGAQPGGAGTPSSVTGQVLPEVTRLVTRGDGTHRVTVKLAPEALGEVRVVLTVRRGEVHVRITGSEAAQQALLQGQSDLHRLLAGSGATTSSVQVGDQAATLGGSTEEGRPGHGGSEGASGSSGERGADVRRDASGEQRSGAEGKTPAARSGAADPTGDTSRADDPTPQDHRGRHWRRLDVSV